MVLYSQPSTSMGSAPVYSTNQRWKIWGGDGEEEHGNCEYTKHVQAFLNYHCSLNNMV